jgi:hypothetical protein
VALAGLAAAIAFLVAAVTSLALPPAGRLELWLPVHLVLAGGAATAIAAMVPFFVAALSVAPPAHPPAAERRAGCSRRAARGGCRLAGDLPQWGRDGRRGLRGRGIAVIWSLRRDRPRHRHRGRVPALPTSSPASSSGCSDRRARRHGALGGAEATHGWLNTFGFVCP